MKILLIILSILVLAFVASQIFALNSQKNIETYPYTTVKTFDTFEIRRYEASLFTSVTLATGEYEQASGKGFSILAGYIFGGNANQEKIAMTSPVAMSLEDSMTMMFMVPKKIAKEDLPKPNAEQIELREEPAKTVAAISFKGWANSEKIAEHRKALTAALAEKGIAHKDNFSFLGYNAPYEFFNRKNEIIVELAEGAYSAN